MAFYLCKKSPVFQHYLKAENRQNRQKSILGKTPRLFAIVAGHQSPVANRQGKVTVCILAYTLPTSDKNH